MDMLEVLVGEKE